MNPSSPFALAIHGGAGNITPQNLPLETEGECRAALAHILQSGFEKLQSGRSSLDVVEHAVRLLEDCPHFNAGHGACLTRDGRHELDASIMDGATLQAGAVAGVSTIRSPIRAARAVMEHSPYVLLMGAGAEAFARKQGLELVDPSYFSTPKQIERWKKLRPAENAPVSPISMASSMPISMASSGEKNGTVGAVALDRSGHLSAATSTGGMMNKEWGRVGDAPIIGAGTYANSLVAVSSTGHGEHFLCNVVAFDIAALMEYRGLSVASAAEEVVLRKLVWRGGDGGVIAVDKQGNLALTFNSAGMFRGSIAGDGVAKVQIFRDDV